MNAAPTYAVPALFFNQRFMKQHATIVVAFRRLYGFSKILTLFVFHQKYIQHSKKFRRIDSQSKFFPTNQSAGAPKWVHIPRRGQ